MDLIRTKKLRAANVGWFFATLLWKPVVVTLELISPSSNVYVSRDVNWFMVEYLNVIL